MSYDLCRQDRIELSPFISRTQAMEGFYEAVFLYIELQNSAQNVAFC